LKRLENEENFTANGKDGQPYHFQIFISSLLSTFIVGTGVFDDKFHSFLVDSQSYIFSRRLFQCLISVRACECGYVSVYEMQITYL
jgi:hypothetical protein